MVEIENAISNVPMKYTSDVEVGVIVGRFQTPFLHEGHMELFEHVTRAHPRVFVFLGQSPLKCTYHDPLDFNTRRAMVEEVFPEIEVHRIDDVGDNGRWSRELDRQIGLLLGPQQSVVLYGSRDSFLKAYQGHFDTDEFTPSKIVSATEIRRSIGIRSKKTKAFREGVIWATQNQYPKVYPTADVALIDLPNNIIWLAKKAVEPKFRLPGGFVDTKDDSYEIAALRELREEFRGVEGKAIDYIGSAKIDDWRYRPQIDKIMTSVFAVTKWEGTPEPADDLIGGDVKPFPLTSELIEQVMPTHQPLISMVLNWKHKIDSIVKPVAQTA